MNILGQWQENVAGMGRVRGRDKFTIFPSKSFHGLRMSQSVGWEGGGGGRKETEVPEEVTQKELTIKKDIVTRRCFYFNGFLFSSLETVN